MAVILVIALLNWSAFTGWSFWVQVCSCLAAHDNDIADSALAVLSKLPVPDTSRNHGPIHSHVYCRLFMHLFRGYGRC